MTPHLPDPRIPEDERTQIAELAKMLGEPDAQRPDATTQQASSEHHRRWRAATTWARTVSNTWADDPQHPVTQLFMAGCRLAKTWERRTKAAEKQLRDVLASDYASDEQRRAVAVTLYGSKGTRRDPKLLTPTEADLIAHYRAASQPDKVLFRTLLARLAQAGGAK